MNGMMYVRGSPHDYDEWERKGATGWSYKDVLPYFKKAENMQDPTLQNSGIPWFCYLLKAIKYILWTCNVKD